MGSYVSVVLALTRVTSKDSQHPLLRYKLHVTAPALFSFSLSFNSSCSQVLLALRYLPFIPESLVLSHFLFSSFSQYCFCKICSRENKIFTFAVF